MRLKKGLTVRKIGDDYVIVAPEQGMVDLSKVYSLNESAAWLWEQIDGKDFEINELVDLLKENYDTDELSESQLFNDMEELVKFFRDNNLLLGE